MNGEINMNDIINVKLPSDEESVINREINTYYLTPEEIVQKYGPPKITKLKLIKMLGEGMTHEQIAKKIGLTGGEVANLVNRYKINANDARKKGKEVKKRVAKKQQQKIGAKLEELTKKLPKKEFIEHKQAGKTDNEITAMYGFKKWQILYLKRFYCLTKATKNKENEQGLNRNMIAGEENSWRSKGFIIGGAN